MARLICCLFSIRPMQVFDQLDISGGTISWDGANRYSIYLAGGILTGRRKRAAWKTGKVSILPLLLQC